MKFKILFIFTLIFSSLPLYSMEQEKKDFEALLFAYSLIRETANWNAILFHAVKYGDIKSVKKCLSYNAEVNSICTYEMAENKKGYIKTLQGKTPLMIAAQSGQIEIADLLLTHHAKTEFRNTINRTALIYASESGHRKIVKLLIENGANVNAVDNYEWTPLSIASINGHTKIVKFLLDHGARASHLKILPEQDSKSSIVKILLKSGFRINPLEINIINGFEQSSLTNAIYFENFIIVELILKHINHLLDETDDPEICHMWDLYILDTLNKIYNWSIYITDKLNALRMILHHADKLPLSTKKLESFTIKTLEKRRSGEAAFRETVKHLRKYAF